MNRSDYYGCSSYWRNNHVQEVDRPCFLNPIKKYAIIGSMLLSTLFFPSAIDLSTAKIPDKMAPFSNERQGRLEERVNKVVFDVSKHNLAGYINSKVGDLISSEGSKKELEKTLSKLSAYDDYILHASNETGLGTNFIKSYLAQESMGDPNAESEKGATGLGGLMKAAAKEVKLKVDKHIDERSDPRAISGSARYMKKCIDRFDDYTLGLIAYNAGPNWTSENLHKILGKGHILKNKDIPFQSRDYVVQVLARTKIFSNPDVYNLQIERKELVSDMILKEYVTKKTTTLKALANMHSIRIDRLKMANPAIKEHVIPKGTKVNIPHQS